MKNVRICPKCGNLVYFNSYFGAYICESCEWEDASYAKKRSLNGSSVSISISKRQKVVDREKLYLTVDKRELMIKRKNVI